MKKTINLSFYLILFVNAAAYAELTTDGTTGAVTSLDGQMVIPQNLGTTVGNNLFHSFQTFNINTGESATFTGSDTLQNVISRVTGGQVSTIDGLLKSEIGHANFYFINPAGVTFGWNATVDVPAAFHVSTANSLKFADGTQFSASNPSASVLTIAEPESFGFVGNQTADINVNGSWFQFNKSNHVSFSASNVLFDYSWLDNPSGNVQIYATGNAPAELTLNASATTLTGIIRLISESWLDTRANGSIHLQGGNILLDNSAIRSNADDADNAGNLSVIANDLSLLNGSQITASALGTGAAGNITATAKNISVDSESSILSSSQGDGNAGSVLLHTDNLQNNGTIEGFVSRDSGEAVIAQIVTDGSQGTGNFKGIEHTLTAQVQAPTQGIGYDTTAYLYDNNTVVEHHFESIYSGASFFTIPQEMGTTVGDNLFHSFSVFNLNQNETVTFTGADTLKNVISRVTGGEVSTIDGLLKSEIGHANFYFINPAGVTFGWNATVDVPAAFHVSTANSVKFTDGTQFSASSPSASVLTIAEPESLGFVGNQTADINFNGSWLQFNKSNQVSFSASNVLFDYSWLDNPSGNVQIYATGNAPAELTFNASATALTGTIRLISDSYLDTAANGHIHLQGGNILLDKSAIKSNADDADNAGNLSVIANDLSILNGSQMSASALGTGTTGHITATAKNIVVDSNSAISSFGLGNVNKGSILLHTDNLQNSGFIFGSISGDAMTLPAQIVTDGSQGASQFKGIEHTLTSQTQGIGYDTTAYLYDNNTVVEHHFTFTYPIINPLFIVPQEMGTTVGDNLFHSFSVFNLNPNETVTFTGADTLKNVISRVTGGEVSTINGVLKSEIPNANFYFINPAGVTFGESAQVDVPAAFHISTANYLMFADGRFFSATDANDSTLSVADTTSLGFLGNTSGGILFNGANLITSAGQTFDVVANNIFVNVGSINAGEVRMVATEGNGEVSLQPVNGLLPIATPAATSAGDIHITGTVSTDSDFGRVGKGINIQANSLNIDASGTVSSRTYSTDNAGSINIKVNSLTNNGSILSESWGGTGNSGNIFIDAINLTNNKTISARTQEGAQGIAGNITIYASGSLVNTCAIDCGIWADTIGFGNAGNIIINAGDIFNNGQVSSQTLWGNTNDAGNITVNAIALNINRGTFLTTSLNSDGTAGNIAINAGNLSLDSGSKIDATAIGIAGNIVVNADNLSVDNASLISTGSGQGNSGNIVINAGNLSLNSGSKIDASVNGNAGNIAINADNLSMNNASLISTKSLEQGNSGNIAISASHLSMDKGSRIDASANGIAGTIAINADYLDINNLSQISAVADIGNIVINAGELDVNNGGGISVNGAGGNIKILVDSLNVKNSRVGNDYYGIRTLSSNGHSGDITIKATGDIKIDAGTIDASAPFVGHAGKIIIEAKSLELFNNGGILSNVWTGDNDAGNISITATDSISIRGDGVNPDSTIIGTSSYSQGKAGDVFIAAKKLLIADLGEIVSNVWNYGSGGSGTVTVNADQITIENTLPINKYSELTGIRASSNGSGKSGVVSITSKEKFDLSNYAAIFTTAAGSGDSGDIKIDANLFNLSQNSRVASDTLSVGNAGNVEVNASNLFLDNARISAFADTGSTGSAGSVTVSAKQTIFASNLASINSSTFGEGNAGAVNIASKQLDIRDGAKVASGTTSQGNAGQVTVIADKVTIDGENNPDLTGINTSTFGSGEGGEIKIESQQLNISNGGKIASATRAQGDAGKVTVTADTVNITGQDNDEITGINTSTFGSGNAGKIELNAKQLNLTAGSKIASATDAQGDAGSVTVTAASILIDNSIISAAATVNSNGKTGDVTVTADKVLQLADQAEISIKNNAMVSGLNKIQAGHVKVTAPEIDLKDSSITAQSTGNVDAGDIEVNVSKKLRMDPSFISTLANLGNGGSITINGGGLINLQNSGFLTSVLGANGNGGNINVAANTLIMDNGVIQANAVTGSGGDINLQLQNLIPSQNQLIKGGLQVVWQPFVSGFNVIQAASANGVNGSINISSPQFNISGSISGLDSAALVLPIIDHNVCQAAALYTSSLTGGSKGGVPDDGLQFSFVPAIEIQNAPQQAQGIITTYGINIKEKSLPCMALSI